MTFRWIFLSDPATRTGSSGGFESQDAAEAWMGVEWQRLLDEGVVAARLESDGDELYTMKLGAE